jgi:dihydroxyacid dehydratase/phosphogluconate dehydratase
MLGKKLAVFSAIEVKTETGKVSPEQKVFLENVKNAGGIAKICRKLEDLDFNL